MCRIRYRRSKRRRYLMRSTSMNMTLRRKVISHLSMSLRRIRYRVLTSWGKERHLGERAVKGRWLRCNRARKYSLHRRLRWWWRRKRRLREHNSNDLLLRFSWRSRSSHQRQWSMLLRHHRKLKLVTWWLVEIALQLWLSKCLSQPR